MSNNLDEKVVSLMLEKLDNIQEDISHIKVEQAVMKTNMERNKEADLPKRVKELETFKTKVYTYGSILMLFVPTIITISLKKFL